MSAKWDKPPDTWLKLNSDGAHDPIGLQDGIGAVVRNDQGRIKLLAFEPVPITSALQAEASALKLDLELIEGFDKVQVELDSLVLVNVLNGLEECPWRIRNTVAECIRRLSSLVTYTIRHVPRSANQVDDWAATRGRLSSCKACWGPTSPWPPDLYDLLLLDSTPTSVGLGTF